MENKQEKNSFTLKKRWFVINQDENAKIEDYYDFGQDEGGEENVRILLFNDFAGAGYWNLRQRDAGRGQTH